MIKISITNPDLMRATADDPDFRSAMLFTAPPSGHKYKMGDRLSLTGLEDYPEFNGAPVVIAAIRQDGPYGKAYYIDGPANNLFNWVYEYRLASSSDS